MYWWRHTDLAGPCNSKAHVVRGENGEVVKGPITLIKCSDLNLWVARNH